MVLGYFLFIFLKVIFKEFGELLEERVRMLEGLILGRGREESELGSDWERRMREWVGVSRDVMDVVRLGFVLRMIVILWGVDMMCEKLMMCFWVVDDNVVLGVLISFYVF